jgi:2-C-methyl-D-erythritol 4-phosphate cytidylyltransferase
VVIGGIVLAAGSGSRFGSRKQHALLGDLSLLDRAITCLTASIDGPIVVVVPSEDLQLTRTSHARELIVIAGGATRTESLAAGLAAVPENVEAVVVHAASHPLATADLATHLIARYSTGDCQAVVPVLATPDTVRRLLHRSDITDEVVERTNLVSTQMPQLLDCGLLRLALDEGLNAQDDAALVAMVGGTVATVSGEDTNLHITTPTTLEMAQAVLPLLS